MLQAHTHLGSYLDETHDTFCNVLANKDSASRVGNKAETHCGRKKNRSTRVEKKERSVHEFLFVIDSEVFCCRQSRQHKTQTAGCDTLSAVNPSSPGASPPHPAPTRAAAHAQLRQRRVQTARPRILRLLLADTSRHVFLERRPRPSLWRASLG